MSKIKKHKQKLNRSYLLNLKQSRQIKDDKDTQTPTQIDRRESVTNIYNEGFESSVKFDDLQIEIMEKTHNVKKDKIQSQINNFVAAEPKSASKTTQDAKKKK